MGDWFALLGVAFALYLIECLAWVRSGSSACFSRPFRERWGFAAGADLPGNDRGGLVFSNPLNFSGALVTCEPWPFSVSPAGLTSATADGASDGGPEFRYVRFEDIRTACADFDDVRINGGRFVRAGSSAQAIHLCDTIDRVRNLPVEDRAAHIRAAFARTLDSAAAARQWNAFTSRSPDLRAWCLVLFAWTFLVSPAVLLLIGPYPVWPYLLGGWFFTAAGTASRYFRIHAALYPDCRYDRWVHALSMVLLPVAAIRCADKLSRDAMCAYGPVAVLPLLCGIDAAAPALRRQWIDLRNAGAAAVDSERPPAEQQCIEWFRDVVNTETRAAHERLSIDVLQAPAREDELTMSYCPRCHAQYAAGCVECAACPGTEVVLFAASDGGSPDSTRSRIPATAGGAQRPLVSR
jgi:hypothetical protein